MDTNKAKSYFWVLLDVLIVCAVINSLFVFGPMIRRYGNSLPSARTIYVSAEGKTLTTPDVALSSFTVVSSGSDPKVLSEANNKKVSAVVEFLKTEGLDSKDIQTTGYNLSPDYRYDSKEQKSYITGYTFVQTVSVKMRDFEKIPEILGGLTPLGVNQIGGITFSVDEPTRFLDIARADAIAKAHAKAAQLAAQAGAILGRVVNIGEYNVVPSPYYSEAYGRGGAMGVSAAPSVPTIEPGSTEIRNQVNITYELK